MSSLVRFFDAINRGLGTLVPVADLAARLWVAAVFFKSGLSKYQTFDSTVMLFQYEYEVPLLSPEAAAYAGTAAELILPVFLALGLLGRYAAVALFVFNVVAVISYPALNAPGLRDHQVWGLLLLFTIACGPGRLSLDYLFEKWFLGRGEAAAAIQTIVVALLGLVVAWYLTARGQGHVAVGVMGAVAVVAYVIAQTALGGRQHTDSGEPAAVRRHPDSVSRGR